MPAKHGFTLIELAIVLIILGLLAGGVLYGQNLIRAAELRSVVNEFEKFQAATITFKGKYFYLPGDMPNAHSFWGSAGGSGVIGDGCESATGTGTETCSGNGNGIIGLGTVTADDQNAERYRFWQHLVNAGLIEGNYNGLAGAGGNADTEPGVNVPQSKVSSGVWYATNRDFTGSSNAFTFALNFGNHFIIGADSSAAYANRNPLFRPEEAWNIDTKIDDGLPAYGSVIAERWDDCTPATASNQFDVEYLLTSTDIACALRFIQAY